MMSTWWVANKTTICNHYFKKLCRVSVWKVINGVVFTIYQLRDRKNSLDGLRICKLRLMLPHAYVCHKEESTHLGKKIWDKSRLLHIFPATWIAVLNPLVITTHVVFELLKSLGNKTNVVNKKPVSSKNLISKIVRQYDLKVYIYINTCDCLSCLKYAVSSHEPDTCHLASRAYNKRSSSLIKF